MQEIIIPYRPRNTFMLLAFSAFYILLGIIFYFSNFSVVGIVFLVVSALLIFVAILKAIKKTPVLEKVNELLIIHRLIGRKEIPLCKITGVRTEKKNLNIFIGYQTFSVRLSTSSEAGEAKDKIYCLIAKEKKSK